MDPMGSSYNFIWGAFPMKYYWNSIQHSDSEDKEFGIPEQKKFPLDSRKHVISAIKFFNYADPRYRKELASKIIRKIKEYGLENSLTPNDNNKFYKYYCPPKYKEECIDSIRNWG